MAGKPGAPNPRFATLRRYLEVNGYTVSEIAIPVDIGMVGIEGVLAGCYCQHGEFRMAILRDDIPERSKADVLDGVLSLTAPGDTFRLFRYHDGRVELLPKAQPQRRRYAN